MRVKDKGEILTVKDYPNLTIEERVKLLETEISRIDLAFLINQKRDAETRMFFSSRFITFIFGIMIGIIVTLIIFQIS
ncbi:hypothetical protein RBU61_08485 [Tissierella sp. MB52-C2]|uniref:hypothetical protein n=1 Tax=Tissierella sp. MB52-C2 TaxID=3070999 RepID=UPI00280C3129|nr:hypothetical protein [Tissierella sp. MB52-C2]WMM26702.1 hypothetical protein RBU61_08485 [Tissierella sp. MB52-C2]